MPLPLTVTVLVKIAVPVQVASFGPYRREGDRAGRVDAAGQRGRVGDRRRRWSTGAEALVVTRGPAWLTMTVSFGVAAGAGDGSLLASPP